MAQYYHTYVTRDKDRWDLIAYKFYGDALRMEPIIVANPTVPIVRVLPSGLKLFVPILPEKKPEIVLPPWRQ
jgi:phage tail protein X